MFNYIYIYGLSIKKNILLNVSINILYNICGISIKKNILLNTTINILNIYNNYNKNYYLL
jgi:hypothetical protein